ncbi:MAG: cold-shock protein [Rhodobacteraceae bacterium]|nr:cold-shock protein [Paracoccaceae bacterium]
MQRSGNPRRKFARDEDRRKIKVAKGTVKWFNADKGYGFIQPADGGKDIFVHISQVQSSGLMGLSNDQPVEFELVDGLDGRQMAGNISVAE